MILKRIQENDGMFGQLCPMEITVSLLEKVAVNDVDLNKHGKVPTCCP